MIDCGDYFMTGGRVFIFIVAGCSVVYLAYYLISETIKALKNQRAMIVLANVGTTVAASLILIVGLVLAGFVLFGLFWIIGRLACFIAALVA